jgi:hypothetical protein
VALGELGRVGLVRAADLVEHGHRRPPSVSLYSLK